MSIETIKEISLRQRLDWNLWAKLYTRSVDFCQRETWKRSGAICTCFLFSIYRWLFPKDIEPLTFLVHSVFSLNKENSKSINTKIYISNNLIVNLFQQLTIFFPGVALIYSFERDRLPVLDGGSHYLYFNISPTPSRYRRYYFSRGDGNWRGKHFCGDRCFSSLWPERRHRIDRLNRII